MNARSPFGLVWSMRTAIRIKDDEFAFLDDYLGHLRIPEQRIVIGYIEIGRLGALLIIDETVDFCSFLGLKKVGVIATEGTVLSGAYSQKLTKNNIEFEVPSNDDQTVVNNIIYGSVKQGKEPDIDEFLRVADSLTSKGCEKIILGCTELSLLKRNCRLGIRFIDPLEVLAIRAISECGAASCGFDNELVKFSLEKGCK